jgi:hypothetical protein
MRHSYLRLAILGVAALTLLAFATPASAHTVPDSAAKANKVTNQCTDLATMLHHDTPNTQPFSATAAAALDDGCAAYVATSSTPSELEIEFLQGVPGTSVPIGTVRTQYGVGVNLTDLALASDGTLYGIDFTSTLWTISTGTAVATSIRSLGEVVNGLVVGAYGQLIASGNGIDLIVNPKTGLWDGWFYTDYNSSGDLAVNSKGTLFMTATSTPESDRLVAYNGKTGVEDPTKDEIGWPNVYGLVSSDGTLYGATLAGNLLTINPKTGKGTLVHTGAKGSPVAIGPSINGMTTPPNHT